MKLNHVLVVFKRDFGKDIKAIGTRNAVLAERIGHAQKQHSDALERVKEALEHLKIRYSLIDRRELKPEMDGDLLLTLGGDGTVLATAHVAGRVPILGINSMPAHSVGFFCAAKADGAAEKIGAIAEGLIEPTALPLIEAAIDGKPVQVPALNEILFAGSSPAETVRYAISVGGASESQRSSGVWIAAGPGSTAAMHSAGGKHFKVNSGKLQFLVREPCTMPGQRYKILKGVLREDEHISIISEMDEGRIYIDGPKVSYPMPAGSELTARISEKKLTIFL